MITWIILASALGSGWPENLHQSTFLRVRSPSISTIEGINRTVVEFVVPFQAFDRVELHLMGLDSTSDALILVGYTADGVLSVGDLTIGGPTLAGFVQPAYEGTVIDVTGFVRSQVGPYVGFRLQLADEAGVPLGLNVRSEWETTMRLVVYPACYADCNPGTGPGVLDIFDFLCFQEKFVAASPYACGCDTSTGSGVCDIFDFLCFQTAFVVGCV